MDFTAWLWAALGEMRSSRDTWLRIEKPGIEVRTEGAGGRFEQKVELPDAWVRGFLQLQGAMAPFVPRCFAAAVSCCLHFATGPCVRNAGSHGSRASRVTRDRLSRMWAPAMEEGRAMGFVDWLKGLFRPRLFFKPGHRRTVRRDPRLLPKPRQKGLLRKKRKKWMGASEARRLFAGTLRTRNQHIRDLLPDEEQLQRLGLPLWRTEEDLATALGISVGQLRFFSIHREAERVPHYVTFSIPKRNGGRRLIMAPKRRLKALQRKLLPLLVDRLPVSGHAHGFRAGRSIRSGAEPHVGKAVVLKMDLADFFPSVTYVMSGCVVC
ncbi:hypothetical protein [Archangium sp.]|uniref:hypothetical protein n=1 Tax=Archangium sp. TaxID=1872627 RepID=UPI002D3A13AF|nr:hypothetical protein [Archangium sp.]HYO52606.1 hypothetical protein [Archangium sp.]